MKQQLLLLEDVDGLGRSGDVVNAKPGYVRNYLLPKKKVALADKQTLKMQVRLKAQREQQAKIDRKDAEELAAKLVGFVLTTEVKVDSDGKLYGSVSIANIVSMMQERGYPVEKKDILLTHPIKTLGTYPIKLKLKEDVSASFQLEILPEGALPEEKPEEK